MQGTTIECIQYLTNCDQDKRYEVKDVKRNRSQTQNAYYWSMLNKLAAKLRMPNREVHMNMLRDYGKCELFLVQDHVPAEEMGKYFEYYDVLRKLGASYEVKVYTRSSHMDSAEFSRLIDGMREECVAQGIDVLTPEEIASLKFEGA